MWIRRKEYNTLMDEKQSLEDSLNCMKIICGNSNENNAILSRENMRLRDEIEQLKVKYADEVKKNFELASFLSENKKE